MSHTSHHPKDLVSFRTPNQICVALSAFFPHPILCGINNALLASTRSYFQMVTNSFVARDLWLFAPQTHQTMYIFIILNEQIFSSSTFRSPHQERHTSNAAEYDFNHHLTIYICMNTRIPATLEGLSLSRSSHVFGLFEVSSLGSEDLSSGGMFVAIITEALFLSKCTETTRTGAFLWLHNPRRQRSTIYFICIL